MAKGTDGGGWGDTIALHVTHGAGRTAQGLHAGMPMAMTVFDVGLGAILCLMVVEGFPLRTVTGMPFLPIVELARVIVMALASLSLVGAGFSFWIPAARHGRISSRMQWAATVFLTLIAGLYYIESYLRYLPGHVLMDFGITSFLAFCSAFVALISLSFAVWSHFWGCRWGIPSK
jgi:magnesium-transporting ATPase (P-type)